MCCKNWKTILPFALTFLVGIFAVATVKRYVYLKAYQTAKTVSFKLKTPTEGNGTGSSGSYFELKDSDTSNLNKPLTVFKSGVKPLIITSKPKGVYTDEARQNQTQGTVRLSVHFLASGAIGSISVVNGLPDGLTEQAIAAARKIEFEPQIVNGVAKRVAKLLDYSFTLY